MSRLKAADAARLVGIRPRTLHRWAREGRVVRHPDGFDVAELLAAEASRSAAALYTRAGIRKPDWPREHAEPG